jgi:hypothetical protein
MIARVALVLCRLAVDAHPSDDVELKNSEISLGGGIVVVVAVATAWGVVLPAGYNTMGHCVLKHGVSG